jgi:hypothetical protein
MAGEGSGVGTFTDKFFVLRGFLPGDTGRSAGLGGAPIVRLFERYFPDLKLGSAIKDSGESGDELGVI